MTRKAQTFPGHALSICKAGLAAGLLCLGQAAAALEVAPYFQVWGGETLQQGRQVGLDSATLAFGVTNGHCSLDPRLTRKLEEARLYVASGAKLLISMGGAEGVYAEIACSDAQLFSLMESLMQRTGMRNFDWDIEGQQLTHAEGNARRARVLARLQAKYPNLFTSFTLTGRLNGLSAESMHLLRTTLAAGVRIDRVNVMTMSYGRRTLATLSPSTVGQAAMVTFRAAAEQLATLYPGKTVAQLHAMMGITPMIGANDDDTVFTLEDAQVIANFVKDSGIGFIAYWSFQRDRAQARPGYIPLGSYSGVQQGNQQFLTIFNTAYGAACVYPGWVEGRQYEAGNVVSYRERLFVAKHGNPGYIPTVSTYYWSPYSCPGLSNAGQGPAGPAS